jgi:ABC-2 type transport system ATP-binding protein
MPPHALEIRGLKKSFKRFSLGPLDVTVPGGSIYGFVGPNGAGKTTTIDLILGMGAKDAGSIRVLGLDHLTDELRVRQQVGYVSPDLDYQRWGRVGRAIQFVKGFYPSWDHSYCERLLTTFHLGRDEKIVQLSFGARIKLSLVLALSWRPTLLLLDEPTVGLDAIAKQQVFAELLSAVGDGERTVFISSHAITDLERFADHVGMIKDGQMLFEGPTDSVTAAYRMVDFVTRRPLDFADAPGVFVQRRDEERWRVLLDSRKVSLELIEQRGASHISDVPVSLEELFVALGSR